ncbi:sigma-70 family RNA polymerase sigma factor [Agrobacterium vitis]|uniref:RNA polymerase sigma factor n=1 Tax=Rhizobium/Agrobacterium group TaxID=227290 RepID=UPI0008DC161E|nr:MULTISPECIES: RNA polymerase sigma factor [Rhizobium/Agrobacterium group]MCF1436239.1 RNA polymerase sigma factor [Allorhizobium ampelinum]MUO89084.1 sigma-70 family RNA polymerase sigma factor [Agrobacterium vitis]MUZ53523.1 sigma-70 family RNA polymerase sigma factor [Agrobacterium vitis]MUZ93473.1 sigma-70 family RNA polymerase sigma factor [Agrobacterium vitis]MVA42347.1 sigma-70 family RNA polymerase sigma factor [Agrobacterium vitis]
MSRSSSSSLVWDTVDSSELLNRAMEAHYADITNAVRRRGHPSSTARDVVHDLYVKLAAKPEVLLNKRSIKAFLCRAAINLGIDRQRRETKEARLFSGSEREALFAPSTGHAPDHTLEIEARLAALREAIAELPERRRVVFILHRLYHLTPDQISTRLNISRNMVDRHLRRAFAHCLDRIL